MGMRLKGYLVLLMVTWAMAQGWRFRVGDRVEVDYLRGDGDWRAGTVSAVDGTFVTVNLDDGHTFGSNAGDPLSRKWFRPLPGSNGQTNGAGTSGAQFKVGDRVEVDPLQMGQFKPATVVAIEDSGFYIVDIDSKMATDRAKIPMRTPEKFIRALPGGAPAPAKADFPANAIKASGCDHSACSLTRQHMLASFLEYESEVKLKSGGYQDVRFVVNSFDLQPKREYTYLNPAGMLIRSGRMQQPVNVNVTLYAKRTMYDGTTQMRVFKYPKLKLAFMLENGRCNYTTEGGNSSP